MTSLEAAKKIKQRFGDLVSEPTEFRGEITLTIGDAEQIVEVCTFAKQDLDFFLSGGYHEH